MVNNYSKCNIKNSNKKQYVEYYLNFYTLFPISNRYKKKNKIYSKINMLFCSFYNYQILRLNLNKNIYSIKVKTLNIRKVRKFKQSFLRASYKDKIAQACICKEYFKFIFYIKIEFINIVYLNIKVFFELIKQFTFFESNYLVQWSKEISYRGVYKIC